MENLENTSLSELQKRNDPVAPKSGPDFSKLSPEEQAKVQAMAKEIDLTDSQQLSQFGVGAQSALASFADNILSTVRSKDTGGVGNMMSELMVKVKDLDISSLNDGNNGFVSRLFGGLKRSVNKFIARYEKMDVQIDKIVDGLDRSRMDMLKDIGMFDTLYKKNLEAIRYLDLTILAGEQKLEEVNTVLIPQAKAAAETSGDPLESQKVNDLAQLANRFDKKIYDLKLSRVSAIQTGPQIRLIQSGDQVLVDKIQTSILNTIPLWKNQIVIAIGLFRQNRALEMQREVTDTTNDLLKKNSEMLKQNTTGIARESERGIIEIETLKKVNSDLISTLEETLKIQADGKAKRQQAEVELGNMEQDLKQKLIQISGR
ncbi:toxic anion resistance protein [Sporolactobacillus shoreae]|uniref:Toxic anion resistance protein n=1 Tax=Sporolactobacillus shoreae TaxID=1465501 RepID=A0A4Z0GKQ8_9BACL|nr:toxic anion resistance protein [Sporolactobacillus shoreae]TGA97530.1 toxic anion resistance protein [Sporolactobacillus shoreae]